MVSATSKIQKNSDRVARYADMFSAIGTEPRQRRKALIISAPPDGLVNSAIKVQLESPRTTLSHHLDKLRNEDLVRVERRGTFLCYTANTESLREIVQFLYAECCTRNKAVKPQDFVQLCK